MTDVYITNLGKFFPGPPVCNDEMESHLGFIHGRPSRAKVKVLAQNGIQTRHYAIDREQRSQFTNSAMAANAIKDLVSRSRILASDIDYLAAATTQGDLCVPGFASLVHAELGQGVCEIASLGGVCAGGMAALKSAYLQVRAGEKHAAVACASESGTMYTPVRRSGLYQVLVICLEYYLSFD